MLFQCWSTPPATIAVGIGLAGSIREPPGPRDFISYLFPGLGFVDRVGIHGQARFNRPLFRVEPGAATIEGHGLGNNNKKRVYIAGGPGVELERAVIGNGVSHFKLSDPRT